jgi:hypothetical protein
MNLKQSQQGQKLTWEQTRTVFTHDITIGLEDLLSNLHHKRRQPLIWQNFIHPGDPVAYPLATVIPNLINAEGRAKKLLDIRDVAISGDGIFELIASLTKDSFLALINGGQAHNSYFRSEQVAQQIVQGICRSVFQSIPVPAMAARK